MYVPSHLTNQLHPALIPATASTSAAAAAANPQRLYHESNREAVRGLAAGLVGREADLQAVESDIEAQKKNPVHEPELRQLDQIQRELGLLESRLENETQKLKQAESQLDLLEQKAKNLTEKIARKKESAEGVRKQMNDAEVAHALKNLALRDVPARPKAGSHAQLSRLAQASSSQAATTRSSGDGASSSQAVSLGASTSQASTSQASTSQASTSQASISELAVSQTVPLQGSKEHIEQRIDELTRQQSELAARTTELRREATKIRGEAESAQKTQRSMEIKREKWLRPDQVATPKVREQLRETLERKCLGWGLQLPRSEAQRKKFIDVLLDRLSEPVPGANDPNVRQLKSEITATPLGVFTALASLLAYLHPTELDTSLQESVLSSSLGLAKAYPDSQKLAPNLKVAASRAFNCSHMVMDLTTNRLESRIAELQSNTESKTYRFHGYTLRKDELKLLLDKHLQLASLLNRHQQQLYREVQNQMVGVFDFELEEGDVQTSTRREVNILSLQQDTKLIDNEVRQQVVQREKNEIAQEIANLRQELAQLTSTREAAPDNQGLSPLSTPLSSGAASLEPETKLSAITGELEGLGEKLGSCLDALRAARQVRDAANAVIGATREEIQRKRIERDQLKMEVTEGSAAMRGLYAKRSELSRQIKLEIERIKNDPVINKLISPVAFDLVLRRHVDQSDDAMRERSFIVGRSGTYASFSMFLRALADVHQDATERFPELMCAPSVTAFEQAKQVRALAQDPAENVSFKHAEKVGWAYHAGAPDRDTPIDTTASVYSLDWVGVGGPVISHLYPSARDQ